MYTYIYIYICVYIIFALPKVDSDYTADDVRVFGRARAFFWNMFQATCRRVTNYTGFSALKQYYW